MSERVSENGSGTNYKIITQWLFSKMFSSLLGFKVFHRFLCYEHFTLSMPDSTLKLFFQG